MALRRSFGCAFYFTIWRDVLHCVTRKLRQSGDPVNNASPTISLRLSDEVRERLDSLAARTRRSRSFLMQEALARYLDEIEREQTVPLQRRSLSKVFSMAGAGADARHPRSAEEINKHIRWLRGDD